MADVHVPVRLERVLELLAPALSGGGVFVDATAGLGGHSDAVLQAFPEARVVSLDRDPNAVAATSKRLAEYGSRAQVVHARYDEMTAVLHERGIEVIRAALFDLGLSSMQIDRQERGFAYSRSAPLDMRMDTTSEITAATVLNEYPVRELSRILWQYGQERNARRIAKEIVARRPLVTSDDLVAAIDAGIPAPARRTGGNPAKRTFQAIRIEVNAELDSLRSALPQALSLLDVGGRFVALSYHSLEDRMVKERLRAGATTTAPPDMPVIPPDSRPWLRLLTRGSEVASEEEISSNPRAHSVRLRAAEKIREAR